MMQAARQPTSYQIRIAGHLSDRWLGWFDGLSVTRQANGETTLSGALDQAALHGILNRIRDLGLELIEVKRSPAQDENER